jgi:formylglycine-generating enzyme required for sulfatase activity
LAAPTKELGKDFERFLASQAATQSRFDSNTDHPIRETLLILVVPTPEVNSVPAGMVVVKPRRTEVLTIQMRGRECGFYDSLTEDKKGFWSSYSFQTREFERRVQLHCFAIDETPVTNAQFAEFLKAKFPEALEQWSASCRDERSSCCMG